MLTLRSFLPSILLIFLIPEISLGQWQQMNGPSGGTGINCMAVSGSILYAGTNGAGVFASTNNGESWSPLGLVGDFVSAITVSDSSLFVALSSTGLFRSSNGGHTWEKSDSGLRLLNINAVVAMGSTLLAGGRYQLYRSTNNGKSWALDLNSSIECLTVSGSDVFADWGNGILCSTDSGLTWSKDTIPLSRNGVVVSIAAKDSILCVGTYGGYGIDYSKDDGRTWSQGDISDPYVRTVIWSGSNLFAGTDFGGVFRSIDSGATWNPVNFGLGDSDIFAVVSMDSDVFAGTLSNGVFRSSNDGAHWASANDGMITFGVSSFTSVADELFAASGWGVMRLDSGENWTIADSIENLGGSIVSSGSNLYWAVPRDSIFRSTDLGGTWKAISASGNDVLAVSGAKLFAADGGIMFTTDSGTSWSDVYSYLPMSNINAMVADSTFLIAGSYENGIYRLNQDGSGLTNFNMDGQMIYSLAANDSDVYAGTLGSGVYHSTNFGKKWTTDGLSGHTVLSLLVIGANLFAGTDSGVFLSTDVGSRWQPINTGLLDSTVLSFSVKDSFIYAGTETLGVWRRRLSDLITIPPPPPPPSNVSSYAPNVGFSIEAFPNPSAGRTDIECTSPVSGSVRIFIVNMLGEEITQVFQGYLNAGTYSFNWNPDAYPDGCYFCVLHSNSDITYSTPLWVKKQF